MFNLPPIDPLPPHLDPSNESSQASRQQWMNRAYIVGAIGLAALLFSVTHFHHAPPKAAVAPATPVPAPMDEITMEKTALELQEKGNFA
ncbi:MAG: hypothetical protein ABJF10_24635, partial [Chthoniobacter sp.]|uniref:hypothetical protein n=1 Tax=Chthoniobacter sp. TaxID=2510640 RepID=UPI0032A14AFE